MPDGILKEVAEVVRADLQTAADAGDFALTFTAVRQHGDREIEENDFDLHVDVIPVKVRIRSKLDDQSTLKYYISIDVGVRKRCTQSEQDGTGKWSIDEVDTLDLLTQQIHEHFIARADFADPISWDEETELEFISSGPGGNLRTQRMYVGIVRLPFVYRKALT